MKTLTVYTQTDNQDFYMATYDDQEALNLAFKGSVTDAIDEALLVFGLTSDEVVIEAPEFFTISDVDRFQDLEEIVNKTHGITSEDTYLEGVHLTYQVEVTNKNKVTKEFEVIFQNEERHDGMRNYSNYGVDFAGQFGCDADESGELESFLAETDEYELVERVNAELSWKAKCDSKEIYESLI